MQFNQNLNDSISRGHSSFLFGIHSQMNWVCVIHGCVTISPHDLKKWWIWNQYANFQSINHQLVRFGTVNSALCFQLCVCVCFFFLLQFFIKCYGACKGQKNSLKTHIFLNRLTAATETVWNCLRLMEARQKCIINQSKCKKKKNNHFKSCLQMRVSYFTSTYSTIIISDCRSLQWHHMHSTLTAQCIA